MLGIVASKLLPVQGAQDRRRNLLRHNGLENLGIFLISCLQTVAGTIIYTCGLDVKHKRKGETK